MRTAAYLRAPADTFILLVDDNPDGNLARRSVLEELGYRVASARSGSEALKLAKEDRFDLVITDYKMSPVNGLELIRSLRENQFEKPIILLTGFAENLGLKADTTGADVVIQKSANEVVTLLRHAKRLLNVPRKPAASQAGRARRRVRAT